MCMTCNHTIHRNNHNFAWSRDFAPALTCKPGETIHFECLDSGAGHFTGNSTVADVATIDFAKVNPVSGPVFIEGAEPGDAVKITFRKFIPSGVGWTANIPGFGLLADQFPEPALHLWTYDPATMAPALYGPKGRVPLKAFAGEVGLAPAEPGQHSVVPPRAVGGNLDIRDLSEGSTLYLPVQVASGLFSIGDTHAAQGDGEVCGTAIESQMDVELTLDLVKGANLKSPRFTTPGPVSRHLDVAGYEATTGVGPDLMTAAREAVSRMIDLLGAEHGLNPVEAYMLLSVCGDLRISEIVDQPNWVISFYFPRIVFS
jgi:acetamidase/formamidase